VKVGRVDHAGQLAVSVGGFPVSSVSYRPAQTTTVPVPVSAAAVKAVTAPVSVGFDGTPRTPDRWAEMFVSDVVVSPPAVRCRERQPYLAGSNRVHGFANDRIQAPGSPGNPRIVRGRVPIE
jgi:hypothetical protein